MVLRRVEKPATEVWVAIEHTERPLRFGPFDVRGKIGEGGMATVYLGRGKLKGDDTPSLVALKVIKQAYSMNSEFVTMFGDEAKIVSRLHHPNIVRVFELGAEGSRIYIAMEFLNGQSLWQVWAACRERGVRLRYDMVAHLGARVAEALHHAHELGDERTGAPLGIVHRDVNPSNLYLTYDGRVKVIDFGLAKAANKIGKTRTGIVKGKLAYLAPEQALGEVVDRRTDVYALGITLWELTTDRRLFKSENDAETIERVLTGDVPDPTELVEGYPPELWAIVRRALARDPAQRYASAADMALALDAFCRAQGEPITEAMLAGVIGALFASEKAQNLQWLESADVPNETFLQTLRPEAGLLEEMSDMPQLPLPPPMPANLPLGDFAPPSLPLLPAIEHGPASSSRSGAGAMLEAAPASSKASPASSAKLPPPAREVAVAPGRGRVIAMLLVAAAVALLLVYFRFSA